MSDGGYDGGYELEQQHGDLEAGHEQYGQEYDHDQHFAAIAEAHAQEHDVNFAHGHHVEYDDGHGGHYEETDFTVYSEHDAQSDTLQAEEYSEHEHAEQYADLSYLQEHFDSLISEHQPHEIGHEVHGELGPAEHYSPEGHGETYEPEYAPDVRK